MNWYARQIWFEAVNALAIDDRVQTARDYLLLLLFTGLRIFEAARLEWADVDIEGRTLSIRQTKAAQVSPCHYQLSSLNS